jgi:hypothetical protein
MQIPTVVWRLIFGLAALIAVTFTPARSFAAGLDFSSGWNLVASRIAITASESFGDPEKFTSIWKWQGEGGKWAVHLPGESEAGAYAAGKGFAVLTAIEPGEGFWINAKSPAGITLTGEEASASTLSLIAGWNLKGLLTPDPITVATIFDQSTPVTSVWKWQGEGGKWAVHLPGESEAGAYAAGKGFAVLTVIEPGEGFWVNTKSPAKIPVAITATPLNDTGIDWCADDTANYAMDGTPEEKAAGCAAVAATHPNQDGHHGRDAVARTDAIELTDNLEKTGHGAAGFDFTKLRESNGKPLSFSDYAWSDSGSEEVGTQWGCVRDNRTGLVWEVKSGSAVHLRSRDNTYTWYNSDSANNGGNAGTADGGSCSDSGNCNTEKFVAAVNAQGLCGAHDWRLPTRSELFSIADKGRHSPAIDNHFFPHVSLSNFNIVWTATTVVNMPAYAWVNHLGYGDIGGYATKSSNQSIRLVSGGQ